MVEVTKPGLLQTSALLLPVGADGWEVSGAACCPSSREPNNPLAHIVVPSVTAFTRGTNKIFLTYLDVSFPQITWPSLPLNPRFPVIIR